MALKSFGFSAVWPFGRWNESENETKMKKLQPENKERIAVRLSASPTVLLSSCPAVRLSASPYVYIVGVKADKS